VLKSPTTDFILKRLNSVHTITPNFLNIRFILSSHISLDLTGWLFLFRLIFPTGLRYVPMHTVKADGGGGSRVQHILNLTTRRRWMVNFTPRPF